MKREVVFFAVAVLLLSVFITNAGLSSTLLDQKNGWSFSTSTRDTSPQALPMGSGTGYSLAAGEMLSVSWNSAPYGMGETDSMRFYLLNSHQIGGWQWVHEYGGQHEATSLGYIIRLDNWKTTVACLINSTDTYYVIFVCVGDYSPIGYVPAIYVYSYAAYLSSSPSVSITPRSAGMDLGQSQLFFSMVSGGTSPYAYQWYLDGAAVPGATSYAWTLTPSSSGSFSVHLKVRDSAGFTVDSAPAMVYVNLLPNASISPSSAVLYVGQSQLFTSIVSHGTAPYSYQWYLNGVPQSGANSSSWVFTPRTPGSYIKIYVKVTDSAGVQATSNVATVTVKSGPWVSISPSSIVIDIGQSQLITSSVNGGNPPYVYHWFMDGLIRDHHDDSWLVSTYGMIGDGPNPLASPGPHTVRLIVTDNVGASAISNDASFTVNSSPSVAVSPASATLAVGQSQTFTSSVSGGSPPYSYQWCLNGSIVSGATSPTWNYAPKSPGFCSVYLNATDNVGVTVESNTASVTVSIAWKLTVSSMHGSPNPGSGDHFYIGGAPVTCSINSQVTEGGVTYICTGWNGTGSVPPSGTGTSTSFTMAQDSSITWNWNLQDVYAKQGIVVGDYSTSQLDSYFTAEISVFNWSAPRVLGYQLQLRFDNTVLEAVSAEIPDGHWLTPKTNPANIFVVDSGTINQATGTVSFCAVVLAPEMGSTGSGVLATVTFKVLRNQSCTLRVEDVKLADPYALSIPSSEYSIINGSFSFILGKSTDINGDGVVDILDLAVAARAVRSYPGHPDWDERCDLNDDGSVNILDLVMVATDFTY